MEKKLAVIVDNKEVTTEVVDTEMCSSACDVAMQTCSSQNYDACRNSMPLGQPKTGYKSENFSRNERTRVMRRF